MNRRLGILVLLILVLFPVILSAQTAFPKISMGVEESDNPTDFILTIQILAFMTILSLAPSILIMMTSFTRIIIVFHFLRAALATQSVPSNQILVGLALFMTLFIMKPVLAEINDTALQPYLAETISQDEAVKNAGAPLRQFMLNQTREADLQLFIELKGDGAVKSREELSLSTIIPSFIISELKTAFQIGFLLYLPMLLLDMVVASVLLSMGMMMLPPVMISMPFKILLFVLVDGWNLIVKSLVEGFV